MINLQFMKCSLSNLPHCLKRPRIQGSSKNGTDTSQMVFKYQPYIKDWKRCQQLSNLLSCSFYETSCLRYCVWLPASRRWCWGTSSHIKNCNFRYIQFFTGDTYNILHIYFHSPKHAIALCSDLLLDSSIGPIVWRPLSFWGPRFWSWGKQGHNRGCIILVWWGLTTRLQQCLPCFLHPLTRRSKFKLVFT